MGSSRYDMAVELEASLAGWAAAVTRAHLDLAAKIAAVKSQWDDSAGDDSEQGAAVGTVLAEVQAEIDTLGRAMGENRTPSEAASESLSRLEAGVERLYAELAALRAQAAYPLSAPERPGDAASQLREAGALAARLEGQGGLAAELAEALSDRDEAREEAVLLRAQLEAIRLGEDGWPSAGQAITFNIFDETGEKRRMGEILIDAGVITEVQLVDALAEQRKDRQRRLGSILVELGFTEEDIIARALASQLELPFVRLADERVDLAATRLITSHLATRHMLIPLRTTTGHVVVAMANPLDLIAMDDVARATNLQVDPVVAALSDISEAIVRYYSVT